MPKQYQCAILYHNYYSSEGITDIRNRIKQLPGNDILLLSSVPEKLFLEKPFCNTEDEKFLITSNQGKDIGGKLLLIDLVIKLYSHVPYLILLHDKKSYQKYSGSFEKEKLFEIINPEKFSEIIGRLEADKSIGMIGQQDCLKNEYNRQSNSFKTTNAGELLQLKTQYGINTSNFQFVAGTMFWVRTSVFTDFFKKHNPVQIRATLEKGNVLDGDKGTVTHAWERLFGWIISAAGYKIEGI